KSTTIPQFDFPGLPKLPKGEDVTYYDKICHIKKIANLKNVHTSVNIPERKLKFAKKCRILDKYLILEDQFEDDEIAEIVKNSKNITSVNENDLTMFDQVTYVELNENEILLEELSNLKNVKEIRLACCQLSKFNYRKDSF